MLIERIPDYKQKIIRCIQSSKTTDHLHNSYGIILHFQELFKHAIPANEFKKHNDEMLENYLQKQALLS